MPFPDQQSPANPPPQMARQPAPAPGGGGAPPPRPAAPGAVPAGGPPGAVNVPASHQHMVNPNNAQQQFLLQRFNQLQPPDIQALASAGPAVLNALKRIFPEVGFLFDALLQRGSAGGGAPGAQPAPPPGAGAPPPGGPPPAPGGQPGGPGPQPQMPPRPTTRLAQM